MITIVLIVLIVLIALGYYIIGVPIMIYGWTEHNDLDLFMLIGIMLILWVLWPIELLSLISFGNKTIIKKRK